LITNIIGSELITNIIGSELTMHIIDSELITKIGSELITNIIGSEIVTINVAFSKISFRKKMKSQYSGTCLIQHTKGPWKCVGLYRMSEYSGFILANRYNLGPLFFGGCHRMSENLGVRLHKFHCIS
jgi:hypothetical protein